MDVDYTLYEMSLYLFTLIIIFVANHVQPVLKHVDTMCFLWGSSQASANCWTLYPESNLWFT